MAQERLNHVALIHVQRYNVTVLQYVQIETQSCRFACEMLQCYNVTMLYSASHEACL